MTGVAGNCGRPKTLEGDGDGWPAVVQEPGNGDMSR